ncbi:MAG: hypothetical protein BJ554DRAFT_1931, partial [Olpidium bornovanus]
MEHATMEHATTGHATTGHAAMEVNGWRRIEKAKREAEGKDAENATLKRQVEVLQRQLADHSAVPTYNGTGGATPLTNFIAKVETAAEQAELNEGQTLAL